MLLRSYMANVKYTNVTTPILSNKKTLIIIRSYNKIKINSN